jgi:predicted Rossmann fold nucleotide-binding protein DprA/Smf involved in DNA uptake
MKEGATPVTNAEEVMSELGFAEDRLAKVARSPERLAETLAEMRKREEARMASKNITSMPRVDVNQLVLSAEEKTIYECLRIEPLTATHIVEKTSLPISVFNITISELEMKGLVRERGGRYLLNQ